MGVQGIPTLCVINADGSLITDDGRGKVMADPKGETLPDGWKPQPFNSVNDSQDGLNDEQCLIALGDDKALNDIVQSYATETHEAAGKNILEMPLRFFHAPEGGVAAQIRKLTKIPDGNKLILLDLGDEGAFYVCESEVASLADAKEFVKKATAGDVPKKTVG